MKAAATFAPTKWDEKPYGEMPSPMRMTRASVQYAFNGQFEGTAHTEYVLFYSMYDEKDPHAATAAYVGLTRYEGKLDGKTGGFIPEDRGTFEGGVASHVCAILPGSGLGDLRGIGGKAKVTASHKSAEFLLEYNLEAGK